MPKRIKSWIDGLSPLTIWDVIFYGLMAVFCFFSFNHGDILHTGGSSITLLKGHIAGFYDENARHLTGNNYLLPTYILFAIWNIPVYLLGIVKEATLNVGFVVFWYKALTTLFFIASAAVMYKIGKASGLPEKNAKLLTAFWISSPLLFFSQFIFGQYDIITVFFTLLGLLYYLRKNRALFVLFFGIALTFKYFPALIFVPLLLLAEKKPLAILRDAALFMLPVALVILPYAGSGQFTSTVAGFTALSRPFSAGFQLEFATNISIFIIAWLFICAAAYLKNPENGNEFAEWSMYTAMASSSLFFALVFWHPQWLLFATPFLAITTFTNKKPGFYIFLDFLVMIPFMIFTVNFWAGGVDQALWKLGVFRSLIPHPGDELATVFMKKILIFDNRTVFFSLVSAYFLLNAALKFPLPASRWQTGAAAPGIDRDINAARFRFLGGISIFIIPAVLSVFLSYNNRIFYNPASSPGIKFGPNLEMTSTSSLGQAFRAEFSRITAVSVKVSRICSAPVNRMRFRLSELLPGLKAGKTILEGPVSPPPEMKDYEFFAVTLDNVFVEPGREYIFTFEPDGVENGCLVFWNTSAPAPENKTFAVINGERRQYDLLFKLYGKK